ncbi:DUF4019 domain-containing protein [Termitidicoccus mucosus]|uniref:Peptidase M56 domain-containing protein n=1 Tax=Termitidicoccus mucosus TaxID=1184151 RepID=A0A178INJ2_9BACT|nr:hypothetical protein AW736_03185 [Opitutaceae bacterium TSB47]
MSLLFTLTLRGTLLFAVVWLLEITLRPKMRAAGRRLWWMLVPVGFLLPVGFTVSDPVARPLIAAAGRAVEFLQNPGAFLMTNPAASHHFALAGVFSRPEVLVTVIWLLGVVLYLGIAVVRTLIASRCWAHLRLCTDPALLDLLEDCKACAGVTAPIGVVVSERIPAPALLGWLRPRILLPASLASALSPENLRVLFLHELAHFRAFDIPLHWLHTLARAVHWFNPFVHLSARRWLRFREEAADERAIGWLQEPGRADAYSATLLRVLKLGHPFPVSLGALALGESIKNLKQRMIMITNYTKRTPHSVLAVLAALVLATGASFLPARAQPAAEPASPAIPAMKAWLAGIDAGKYAQSWDDAATFFKKTLPRETWEAALKNNRAPLGALKSRQAFMAQELTEIPAPDGSRMKGEYAVVIFNASFANAPSIIETVTFEKESDGAWRAVGYFIRPRP